VPRVRRPCHQQGERGHHDGEHDDEEYGHAMSDESISARIERLVTEEHSLRSREERDSSDESALAADKTRLDEVAVELDRCWDLLRQRRALRAAGADPDGATVRDADTVEHYQQ
jgi:hypothetical protein